MFLFVIIAVHAEGKGGTISHHPCLENLGKIKLFRAGTKKYLGKNQNVSGSDRKNLGNTKNFRAAVRNC